MTAVEVSEVRSQIPEVREDLESEVRKETKELDETSQDFNEVTQKEVRSLISYISLARRLAPWVIGIWISMTLLNVSQTNIAQEDLPETQPQMHWQTNTDGAHTTSGTAVILSSGRYVLVSDI